MYWLTLDWIVTNWMPLAAALALGFILGWLLTGLSPARRASELEARVLEVEGKHRKAERDAGDLRRQVDPLNARLATLQNDADEARAKADELAARLQALDEEKLALAEEPAAEFEELAGGEGAAAEEDVADVQSDEFAQRGTALDGVVDVAAAFSATAQSWQPPAYDPREVALSEAYARAAALQQEVDEQNRLLSTRSAELDSRNAELVAANAVRKELETRLLRAREDVASELAMLASTMIKMKDDALARADSRILALSTELETLRSGASRGPARSTERAPDRSSDRALDTAD